MTREQEVHELIRQLKIKAADPKVLAKLEEHIDEMTGEIETLKMAVSTPDVSDRWVKFGMTRTEARIMRILEHAGPKGTNREVIYSTLYFARPNRDDLPEIKIIDVFMVRIRKKLQGTSFSVKTIWGSGYILTTA